jgi:hypothetical protein
MRDGWLDGLLTISKELPVPDSLDKKWEEDTVLYETKDGILAPLFSIAKYIFNLQI